MGYYDVANSWNEYAFHFPALTDEENAAYQAIHEIVHDPKADMEDCRYAAAGAIHRLNRERGLLGEVISPAENARALAIADRVGKMKIF